MKKLKEINLKVLSYSSIPTELSHNSWINDYPNECYIMCHIPDDEEKDDLDNWIIENYPELQEKEFLIEMDY